MRPPVFAIALRGREATMRAQTAAGHPVWGCYLARDRRGGVSSSGPPGISPPSSQSRPLTRWWITTTPE
jgi:hypothetical protein